jgi:DMSO/TMAO reductase YedYZ molybdopterin-dependent catalytic subunit
VGNLFPVGGWRIYTVSGSMPVFDPKEYRLEVGGLVRRPRSFSYEELLALPQAHQVSTFRCVTGWTVRDVRWSGVRFSHLLSLVEPLSAAKALRFDSMEVPYNDSLTIEQLGLHDVMLALRMDGQPLSRPHGAPARVVIPEMYGYKGVKWLSKIELVARQPTGYWEGLGYDQDAWVGRSNGYGT